MEPNSPERAPNPQFPEFAPLNPSQERAPDSYEQERSRVERSIEQTQQQMPAQPLPTPVQLPSPVPVQSSDAATTAPSSNNPTIAADEDLIEKEWVDKAKKIIADTKDDPFKREREIGKLQADYIKKRYGKELGKS